MPENKPFSLEEDKIILYLYDELKIKQWSLVAKKMTEEYKMERNAKQCRDRLSSTLSQVPPSLRSIFQPRMDGTRGEGALPAA